MRKNIDTGTILLLFLLAAFIINAIFVEFPRMKAQGNKRDELIGKYIVINRDTVQVIGYVGGHHTLFLSNRNEIDIDLAYKCILKND